MNNPTTQEIQLSQTILKTALHILNTYNLPITHHSVSTLIYSTNITTTQDLFFCKDLASEAAF